MPNIYLVSQHDNNNWDTYNAMVVCANSLAKAKEMHPDMDQAHGDALHWNRIREYPHIIEKRTTFCCWAKNVKNVKAAKIGTAHPNQKIGVILASFNAG